MFRSLLCFALAIAFASALSPGVSAAENCSRETLRRIVDEAGARLRVITAETQPQIMAALRRLKEKRGWTGADGDEKAAAVMSDDRTAEFDTKTTTLLALIDELSETGAPNDAQCTRLAELDAASLELQATVKAKARHILNKLEQATGDTVASQSPPPQTPAPKAPAPQAPVREAPQPKAAQPAPTPKAEAVPVPAPAAKPKVDSGPARAPSPDAPLRRADEGGHATPPPVERHADTAPPPRSAPAATVEAKPLPPPSSPAAPPPKAGSHTGWSTETSERVPVSPTRPPVEPQTAVMPPPPPPMQGLPPLRQEPSESFTQDEIREATRGFFGTISGGLASVVEHAFSTLGRPTGYVLGNEGGGAFIAGLRYGKGTLFLRDGTKRTVYWHGPSIGYDFGASGAKTMFLVYNLKTDDDLFSGFSGVEGSAYLVGGVGMTALTDGKVVMAPIRSGLGVRIGANIGYIRFTPRPTWNPF